MAKDPALQSAKSDWKAYNDMGTAVPGGEYHGYTQEQVWEKLADKYGLSVSDAKEKYTLVDTTKPSEWEVYDDESGEVYGHVEAVTRSEAVRKIVIQFKGHPREHNMDLRRVVKHRDPEPEPKLSPRSKLAKRITNAPNWEVVDKNTGQVVHRFQAINQMNAMDQAHNYYMDNNLDHTAYDLRPAQSDKEQSALDAMNAMGQRVADIHARAGEYPGAETQVRMPNGVPVWEIYDRRDGSALETMADHTAREAWSRFTHYHAQAVEQGENIGALTDYAVRPKQLRPGERNLSESVVDHEWERIVESMTRLPRRLVK